MYIRTFSLLFKWPVIIGALTFVFTACGGGDSSPVPKTWGTAILVGLDNHFSAGDPQIAMDANGNAFAVWHQFDGISSSSWANHFVKTNNWLRHNNTGWETATSIEENSSSAGSHKIAMDPYGNAIVVWQQFDGYHTSIWANRFDVAYGWGTAVLIQFNDSGNALNPQVTVDANGNAFAVWHQFDGTQSNIWANRYDVVTGWGTASLIESNNIGSAQHPQIAIDRNGNAFAVWEQHDGVRYNIWTNRYDAVSGWGTPILIETEDTGDARDPHVATDDNGNAIVVWTQYDGLINLIWNIWVNRYDASTGWGTAELIENDELETASSPRVAMDPMGNALAVWDQHDGTHTHIWANRYEVATGWGTANLIETSDLEAAFNPQIAINVHGNAFTVWSQHNGTRVNIWANHFDITTGWSTPSLVETNDNWGATEPQIAIDKNGNAIAVWRQSDGTRQNIWANRYE